MVNHWQDAMTRIHHDTTTHLIAERNHRKTLGDNIEQRCLKIIGNSLYGALAFDKYPSYSPSQASSLTTGSRWSLAVLQVVVVAICET